MDDGRNSQKMLAICTCLVFSHLSPFLPLFEYSISVMTKACHCLWKIIFHIFFFINEFFMTWFSFSMHSITKSPPNCRNENKTQQKRQCFYLQQLRHLLEIKLYVQYFSTEAALICVNATRY